MNDHPICEFCGLPRYTTACRCEPAYILGSCTEAACLLCRTPPAQRKLGVRLYHSGKSSSGSPR